MTTTAGDDETPSASGDHAPHAASRGHGHEPHDWHSQSYVDYWIKRDEARNDARRPRIRHMISMAQLPRDAVLAVLDVGGGYGFVTEEVLRACPRAQVTLQDYSQVMLGQARQRLEQWSGQMSYVLADLTDPAWGARAGGPFDLIVSAIAIHNLRDRGSIAACYRAVAGLLKPGGLFLDYDLLEPTGGVKAHIELMRQAGMTDITCAFDDKHAAIIVAHGGGAGA